MHKKYYILIIFVILLLTGCTHNHEYSKERIIPTCINKGYTLYTCSCGDSFIDEYVEETGHDYGQWYILKEATTEEVGILERECWKCKEKEQKEEPIIHVHEYEETTIEATCIEKGYVLNECSCGDSYQNNYKNELGHKFGDWVKVKECSKEEPGLEERLCSRCNTKEYEDLIYYDGEYLVEKSEGVLITGREAIYSFYQRTKYGEKLTINFVYHYQDEEKPRLFYIKYDGENYITNYKKYTNSPDETKYKYFNFSRTNGNGSHILSTESYCLTNTKTMTYEIIIDKDLDCFSGNEVKDSIAIFRYNQFLDLWFQYNKVIEINYNNRTYAINFNNESEAIKIVSTLSWTKEKPENYRNNSSYLEIVMEVYLHNDVNNLMAKKIGDKFKIQYLLDLDNNIVILKYKDDLNNEYQLYSTLSEDVKERIDRLFYISQAIYPSGERITNVGEYVYKFNDYEIYFEIDDQQKGTIYVKGTDIKETISYILNSYYNTLTIRTKKGSYEFSKSQNAYIYDFFNSNPSDELSQYLRPQAKFEWIGYPCE